MGKPRMIIVIRHAQSEGNKNRQIHQTTPDHRVKLTPKGREQAHEGGRRLRALLEPTDTLQIYTSPYQRTRETTQGILEALCCEQAGTPPVARSSIKVWEEPRIREQDFGNFQPNSDAMRRMWQERADYGHFFYRIPNGESAADAYDRVSGFNESLWRSFNEPDFPSVCVLVTHGLMTRVFLMKWFHWSVEYFEDLRNMEHCEFVIMDKNPDNGKYILQNQLRTWSEYRRQLGRERGELELQHTISPPVRVVWKDFPKCEHPEEESTAKSVKRSLNGFLSLPVPGFREAGRDFGGTQSGLGTPADTSPSDEKEEENLSATASCNNGLRRWAESQRQMPGLRTDALADPLGDQRESENASNNDDDESGTPVDQLEALEKHENSIAASVY